MTTDQAGSILKTLSKLFIAIAVGLFFLSLIGELHPVEEAVEDLKDRKHSVSNYDEQMEKLNASMSSIWADNLKELLGHIVGSFLLYGIGSLLIAIDDNRIKQIVSDSPPAAPVVPKRYCPRCGKELSSNTKFCTQCGFSIE